MSKLTDFLVSERGKKLTGLFYGFGASIVIIGALFKILHLPFAAEMLVAGMGTEAFLFALGSFEPPHKEWDWSLVHPIMAMGHGHGPDGETLPDAQGSSLGQVSISGTVSSSGGSDLKALMESGDLTPEDISKITTALKNLGNTANKIVDISGADLAAKSFIDGLTKAGSASISLAEVQTESTNALKDATGKFENGMETISNSFQQALSQTQEESSKALTAASSALISSYEKVADKLTADFSSLKENTSSASKSLEQVTGNLTSINSVYELQLKMLQEQSDIEKERVLKGKEVNNNLSGMSHKINDITSSLEGSIDDSRQFKEHIGDLKKKVSDLNSIYGNMLNALNS